MLKKIAKILQQMQVLRVGRLKFGHFPSDERHWIPVAGIYNTRPFAAPPLIVEDGELSVYLYWGMWEVAVKLKHRRAQCVRGIVQ